MTTAPLAYGIDFGTTNSLVSIAWPDRVEVVDVGGRRLAENLPSVIYLNKDGNRAAGDPAIEQYLIGAGIDSRLLVGIKSDLSDASFRITQSWGFSWTPSQLVGIILGALKRAADRYTGHNCQAVVLGHPVAFVGTEGPDYEYRQETAINRLVEAAQLAGFRQIETLEEPSAAAGEEDLPVGTVVALDFGGGTFDVAVADYGEEGAEVIGLEGAAVGGERFDQLLFNAKVAPELGLLDEYRAPDGRWYRLPARVSAGASSMLDLRNLLLDPTLPDILRRFRQYEGGERLALLEELIYGGFGFSFYESVEEAKIRLSQQTHTTVEFHRRGCDISIPVARTEFNSLIAADIELLEGTIRRSLQKAGVAASDVARVVVRTGGSSSIPLFTEMVASIFGTERMLQRPPFTTVVQGLGSYAQAVWS